MDSNETTYEGWAIRTVTGIDNPDDWTPGKPDRFIVRGYAQWPELQAGWENWSDITPIRSESKHFTEPRLRQRFHAEVAVKLQSAIDARRLADEGW
jgi:hypothetical protein